MGNITLTMKCRNEKSSEYLQSAVDIMCRAAIWPWVSEKEALQLVTCADIIFDKQDIREGIVGILPAILDGTISRKSRNVLSRALNSWYEKRGIPKDHPGGFWKTDSIEHMTYMISCRPWTSEVIVKLSEDMEMKHDGI